MKLSEWAAQQGVHYQTAWRWWKRGTLPVPARQLASGTILVETPASPAGTAGRTVVYARVSAHDQRGDLDRQVSRVMAWASGRQLAVQEVVTEVGSGLGGRRPKLARLLADPQVTTIVVEHRDRLARFGVEQLQAALSAHGAGCWLPMRARPATSWSATWSRCSPACAPGWTGGGGRATGRCGR